MKVSRKELRADKTGNKLIAQTLNKPNTSPTGAPNVIAQGTNAKVVKYVERMLKLAGFNPGVLDNRFSTRTTAALKEFQASVGLPATGSLDKATFGKLRGVQARIRKNGFSGIYAQGQKSGGIKNVEAKLRKLGYNTGKADGVFDAKTAEAVKAFRADQKNVNNGPGYLHKAGQKVLAKEANALSHASYYGRARRTKDRLRLDAETAKAVTAATDDQGEKGIGVGSKGRAVKNIQGNLLAAGFDPKNTGGNFDERTAGALKAFQRKNGLKPTGFVNAQTWKKLRGSVKLLNKGQAMTQRLNEKSATVRSTEKLMKKLGFSPGKIDGIFDRKMLGSVKKMQKSLGLKVDGTVGTGDINKMKQAAKGVTLGQLRKIMPSLPLSKARNYLPLLNRAMAEGKINTVKRKAAFLAQLAHESVSLRYFEEIASGAAYEGRRDLGNVRPGDGRRFKGRGPIQLTGRANYRSAGKALGLPLESNPRMASRPDVGFRIAVWYWTTRGLNGLADKGQFTEITRRINGGYNGLADRRQYYARALKALR